jgi:hypothetical protein
MGCLKKNGGNGLVCLSLLMTSTVLSCFTVWILKFIGLCVEVLGFLKRLGMMVALKSSKRTVGRTMASGWLVVKCNRWEKHGL